MPVDFSKVLPKVSSPLGFAALALGIVEGFLGWVVVYSDKLESEHRFYGMLLGVFLFVLVVSGVGLIVWKKPRNLMYTEEAHLRATGKWGTNQHPTLTPPTGERRGREREQLR